MRYRKKELSMIPDFHILKEQAEKILASIPYGILHDSKRVSLYGAGFLAKWAVAWLNNEGFKVVDIYDSNNDRAGNKFADLVISSVEKLQNTRPDFIFITARHAVKPIKKNLDELNLNSCSFEAYVFALKIDDYMRIHDDLLLDDFSKKTLRAVIMSKLTGDDTYYEKVYEPNQYFCLPNFLIANNEVYVDAGAYVGDSVERYIWSTNGFFSKIYAFEPGIRQYSALKTRVSRLVKEWALTENIDIVIENSALSNVSGNMNINSYNDVLQSSCIDEGGEENIETYPLDEYIKNEKITFLKADVEGMELQLLKGALRTITKWRPKLAICVYHYPNDIYEIITFLKKNVPAYSFSLRHHSPQGMETVLYCWVDENI